MTPDINPELEAADAYRNLLEEARPHVPAPPILSKQERLANLKAMLDTNVDLDKLAVLQEKAAGLLDQILANSIDVTDDVLKDDVLEDLMQEYLDSQEIKDLLEIRYQMIRARIFAHLTATYGPVGGEAEVPKFGKKFTREGGRPKVALDEDKLQKLLGSERWDLVAPNNFIPGHYERKLDHDAVLKMVENDPTVMEIIRECVVDAGTTRTSFHVR